jgi:hypothetical protein
LYSQNAAERIHADAEKGGNLPNWKAMRLDLRRFTFSIIAPGFHPITTLPRYYSLLNDINPPSVNKLSDAMFDVGDLAEFS